MPQKIKVFYRKNRTKSLLKRELPNEFDGLDPMKESILRFAAICCDSLAILAPLFKLQQSIEVCHTASAYNH